MAGTSVKNRVFITTVCTLLLMSPVEMADFAAGSSHPAQGFLPGGPVAMAAPSAGTEMTPGRNDPGVQLNQAREYLERQAVARKLEEDREGRKAKVEAEAQKPEENAAKVTFSLARVQTDPSEILSAEEIRKITDPYIGKTVSLQDLYDMTAAINRLYSEKGFLVCRAYLPPQRIHEGVVQIKMLEGKTGLVTVKGLKNTRKGYVLRRIPLKPGAVANTDELTRRLQLFNGCNDIQLRIQVHAGKEPGTTDYEILAYEPEKNQSFTLYLDNSGYESSGRFRQGLFYTMRSLTRQRDALRLSYLRSRGTDMFGSSYSLPLGNRGTKLDFDYSTNSTEIVKGDLQPLGVKGHAYAAGLTLRHPLLADGKRRYEAGLQYLHQKSQTDLGAHSAMGYVKWVDDVRNTWSPYISFTHYGNSSVLYHKHSFPFTSYNGGNNSSDYAGYQLDMLFQKRYGKGQMLSARLNGQLAGSKDMAASDRFYVGGSSSVRGYEESYTGGNKGMSAGITYQLPLNKKQSLNAFTFFDYGWVKSADPGASAYSLYSTGLGLSGSYKNLYASLTMGIPLKRTFAFTTEKVSGARFDFVCSATF